MAIFGVGVMTGMMFGGLQDAQVMQQGNEAAIFLPGAVGPLVEFIGIGGQAGKKRHFPSQAVQAPGDEQKQPGNQNQFPGTLPPRMPRQVTGVMMMNDVGTPYQATEQWCVFTKVGVFKPMDHAGHKFGREDRSDEFND